MTVCYFIQTHKNPDQIYRLVRTIKQSSPTAQVLLGHDFTSCPLNMTPIQNLSDVYLLRSDVLPIRGDFSLLQPYLNAINWLFEHNSNFEWLIYISGQDYPTQPISKIEEYLANTEYDGFIQYWDVASRSAQNNLNRYFYQYYRFPEWTRWLLKKISIIQNFTPIHYYFTYGLLVGIPAKSTPFNDKFICYRGSQWHTLSRKCIYFIKDFVSSHPEIVNYYRKTIVPDESFIQTILVNSNLFKLCNDYKRFIEFLPGESHPRILTSKDYSTISNGSFHFARKFDLDKDPEIFNMLDNLIL